jgi:hypothetical protein
VTGSCATCHNGQSATGKPASHFQTTLGCEECHTSTTWTSVRYSHIGASYPGQHRRALDCTDCHRTNSQQMSWPNAAYQPDCAACHANDYDSDPHRKTQNPNTRYTVSELRDCTGACHIYTDSTLSVISERRNSNHRVSDSSFDD